MKPTTYTPWNFSPDHSRTGDALNPVLRPQSPDERWGRRSGDALSLRCAGSTGPVLRFSTGVEKGKGDGVSWFPFPGRVRRTTFWSSSTAPLPPTQDGPSSPPVSHTSPPLEEGRRPGSVPPGCPVHPPTAPRGTGPKKVYPRTASSTDGVSPLDRRRSADF